MTHTRITAVAGLRTDEIVTLADRVIRVDEVTEGQLTYRGVPFPVAYVSGRSAAGPVKLVVLSDKILIAAR